jgi:hypothetical protein
MGYYREHIQKTPRLSRGVFLFVIAVSNIRHLILLMWKTSLPFSAKIKDTEFEIVDQFNVYWKINAIRMIKYQKSIN